MKAALLLNVIADYDGQKYTAVFHRIIERFGPLSDYFDKVVMLLRVRSCSDPHAQPIRVNWDKIEVVHLPWFVGDVARNKDGIVKVPWALPQAILRIGRVVQEVDVVGAAVPSVLGNLASSLALAMGKPVFHYVPGDKQATLATIHSRGLANAVSRAGVAGLDAYVRWGVSRSIPTFVVGIGLLEKYTRGLGPTPHVAVVSPVLTADFTPPADRWARIPYRDRAQVMYVGRLSREKGVDVLLRALAALRDRYSLEPDVSIVGDGPEKAHLTDLAAHLDLAEVRFSGLVTDPNAIIDCYRGADLVVVPSLCEGLGAVIPEAMACGVPVVASSVGGIPGIVHHGENGLLVQAGNPEALAAAIASLLDSPSEWLRLSRAAVETAKEYKAEHQIAKMAGVLATRYKMPLLDKKRRDN